MTDAPAHETPLHGFHTARSARMTPFAGYAMPLHYAGGIMAEHHAVRAGAGLFDVSHMGQLTLRARDGERETAAAALERLTPADIAGLAPGRQRYALLTAESGGILDDCMITPTEDGYLLVVNAARKAADLAHIAAHLGADCTAELADDRALIALQGPSAETVLAAADPSAAGALAEMRFMDVRALTLLGQPCLAARSGYTGEDGFEISAPAALATELAEALAAAGAAPAGLGARDSLRLEAGLCLYGSDIDESTTPVAASLEWALAKARRPGGARAGGYLGAARIEQELAHGAAQRRFGLRPEGRQPIRAGAALFETADAETPVGRVTSGVFGPSVEAPVALGYAPRGTPEEGGLLFAEVRGKRLPVRTAPTPFAPHRYKRA